MIRRGLEVSSMMRDFGQEARSMESKKDGKGCVMEWQTDEKKVKEKRIGEEGE